MLLALWWTFWSMVWRLRPLPSSVQQRDRILADRAARTLRVHMKRAGTIRACDPYAKPMRLDCDRPEMAALAVKRTSTVLVQHSLPHHLMNALLRQLDPSVRAQAAEQPEYKPKSTPVDGSIPKSEAP